jgi:hypothetical protein
MADERSGQWEMRVQQIAGTFAYPPTPDLAGRVRRPRASGRRPSRRALAWALAAVLLVVAGLLAAPPVRAGLLEFLRIGAITIRLITPTPAPSALPTPGTPANPLLHLRGRTTLARAREQAGFPIRLPAFPADLGAPDVVVVQALGGSSPSVILIWLVPGRADQVRLALYELSQDVMAMKSPPEVIQTTTVNGAEALWINGPHFLEFEDAQGNVDYQTRRLVEGNALLWVEQAVTYRLESGLPLDETVKIAESLR